MDVESCSLMDVDVAQKWVSYSGCEWCEWYKQQHIVSSADSLEEFQIISWNPLAIGDLSALIPRQL